MAGVSATLTHQMNQLIARQGVVASNVANAATPGYIAKDLEFQPMVEAQGKRVGMATTNAGHLSGARSPASAGKLVEDRSNMQLNGNSVQLDQEMIKLNDIQLRYRMATQLYNKHASLQKIAIGANR